MKRPIIVEARVRAVVAVAVSVGLSLMLVSTLGGLHCEAAADQAETAIEVIEHPVSLRIVGYKGVQVAEVHYNNEVVFRLRANFGGYDVASRGEIVRRRLAAFSDNQLAPSDLHVLNWGDYAAVAAKGDIIVTVDPVTAAHNGVDPATLALRWVNNLRLCLGTTEIRSPAVQEGLASWYGPGFHGRATASGETYNQYGLTAAHRGLPFGSTVLVTNLVNGRSVVVRINDRGPYPVVGGQRVFSENRIIDLSRGAAEVIDLIGPGVQPVRIRVINVGLEVVQVLAPD